MQVLHGNGSKFLESVGRNSQSTQQVYKIGLEHFDKFLRGVKSPNNADTIILPLMKGKTNVYEILDQFVSYLSKQNLTIPSVRLYLNAVKSYFEFNDIDIVPSKYRRRVKLPKHYREDEFPLDISDVRNILIKCHNKRLKTFLLVLVSSGCRVMEICTLRIKDVDFSITPTKIHIRKEYAKTRRSRDVYISEEATNYLKDLIKSTNTNQIPPDDLIFSKFGKIKLPRSIYFRLLTEFEKLLTDVNMDQRKENSRRRKITLHSFRRYVKGIVSDQAGQDFSEWFLGHDHSPYWTRKEQERRNIYTKKCMPYLTILDYSGLDRRSKNIEVALKEKDQAIQQLTKQMADMQHTQKEMQEYRDEMRALLRNPKKLREMIQEEND